MTRYVVAFTALNLVVSVALALLAQALKFGGSSMTVAAAVGAAYLTGWLFVRGEGRAPSRAEARQFAWRSLVASWNVGCMVMAVVLWVAPGSRLAIVVRGALTSWSVASLALAAVAVVSLIFYFSIRWAFGQHARVAGFSPPPDEGPATEPMDPPHGAGAKRVPAVAERQAAEPRPRPAAPSASMTSGADAALVQAIKEQKKNDPLIGAKIGGREVLQRLLAAMKTDKGVHVESLLCALGALAGYACQANLRAQALIAGKNPDAPFHVVTATDGKRYYFGDALNAPLAEGQLSVWSMAAAAAQHHGAQSLPDIQEVFHRTAAAVGSPAFGVPEYGHANPAGDLPAGYVKSLWPALFPTLKKLVDDPVLWPVTYGIAIQEAMGMAKGVIEPQVALAIVMEAAVPMSKVELSTL